MTGEHFGGGRVVYGNTGQRRQCQKVQTKIFFGRDQLLFYDDGGGLLLRDMTWVCSRRQGLPVDSDDFSCCGGDWLGGGGKMVVLFYGAAPTTVFWAVFQ